MGHYHAGIVDLVIENPTEECKKVLAYITMDERNYEKWGLDDYSLRALMLSGEIELSEEDQVIADNMYLSYTGSEGLSFKAIVGTCWRGGSAYQAGYAFCKYDVIIGADGVERHYITMAMSCKDEIGFPILARYLEPWLPKDNRCLIAFKYEDANTWTMFCQGIPEAIVFKCELDDDSDPTEALEDIHQYKLDGKRKAFFGFYTAYNATDFFVMGEH